MESKERRNIITMGNYALVAIGYCRVHSMKRLLNSLETACYDSDDVTLIISIDYSGEHDVEQYAEMFEWTHGEKKVITYPKRQGLRKHILQCGNFVKAYDAIAVFEDDIIAAPGFYQYMKAAVETYKEDDRVAGISLYNHLWNVNVNAPFEPAYSGYDVYFLQYAQSWGQIWMKKQWLEFADWYRSHKEEVKPQENIPSFVSSWPKTSWLKYHIKYCIEKNKYFVYPYHALTTCYSDVGEHCKEKDTCMQIPMQTGILYQYRLPLFDDAYVIRYDAFFERILDKTIHTKWNINDICIDLYGSKIGFEHKRYVLTLRKLPYIAVKEYALELRPHEMNFINDISGNDIKLYDTTQKSRNIDKVDEIAIFKYRFRLYLQAKLIVKCAFREIIDYIKRKLQHNS